MKKTEKEHLKVIWCLTEDGVWKVSVERHSQSIPIVSLGVLNPRRSFFKKETRLTGGSRVAITANKVTLYYPPFMSSLGKLLEIPTLEESGVNSHGQSTGQVFACFLSEQKAVQANAAIGNGDYDGRYENDTIATLKEIGPNHPVFIISRSGPEAFPVWFYGPIGIDRSLSPQIPRDLVSFGEVLDVPPKVEGILEKDIHVKGPKGRGRKNFKERSCVFKSQKQSNPESLPDLGKKKIQSEHITMSLSGICTREYHLPKGRYEVVEFTHRSRRFEDEKWYLIEELMPEKRVGNKISMFSNWFGVPRPYLMKLTKKGNSTFLQTFMERPMKEIVESLDIK